MSSLCFRASDLLVIVTEESEPSSNTIHTVQTAYAQELDAKEDWLTNINYQLQLNWH